MKTRRNHRKQRRGVVMIEALIAISMIIVMFGGVVYFHNAYGAKARVALTSVRIASCAMPRSC